MAHTIDKGLLRKVKENDYKCLCNPSLLCPCDTFLNKDICHCRVYRKYNEYKTLEEGEEE